MPRPPANGCYAIRRPSGQAFIVQWSGGRLVECLDVKDPNPPRRTTTRYLGPSLHEVTERERLERQRRLMEELAVLGPL